MLFIVLVVIVSILWTTYHGDIGLKSALTGLFALLWTLTTSVPYARRALVRANVKAEDSDEISEDSYPSPSSRGSGFFSAHLTLWILLFPGSLIVRRCLYNGMKSECVCNADNVLGSLRALLDNYSC